VARDDVHGPRTILVLSEESNGLLKVVTISIPQPDEQPLNTAIPIGSTIKSDALLPGVEVAVGDVVEEERSDGARIVSAEDPDFAHSEKGSITLYEKGATLSGEFSIDLDDGGHLDGTFQVEPSLR
jgi:hypothetical protein